MEHFFLYGNKKEEYNKNNHTGLPTQPGYETKLNIQPAIFTLNYKEGIKGSIGIRGLNFVQV